MRYLLFCGMLLTSSVWAHQPMTNKPATPSKTPTPASKPTVSVQIVVTPKPVVPVSPPVHHEHHEHHSVSQMPPRLMPPPKTVGAEKTGDPAECLRSGGNGHRDEQGRCMGWDGKPLP